MKFVWKANEHKWSPRKQGVSIGRIHVVPPGTGEKFYLRALLNYVKGPTSYDEIKTVDNFKYDNFKDACFALGLLDDDKEFIDAINQESQWGTTGYLRRLSVALLISSRFSQPEVVWEKTWEHLSDDVLNRRRRILRVQDTCFNLPN